MRLRGFQVPTSLARIHTWYDARIRTFESKRSRGSKDIPCCAVYFTAESLILEMPDNRHAQLTRFETC